MAQFQRARLLNNAVEGAAVEARSSLLALLVDLLTDCCAAEIVDSGGPELLQECTTHVVVEEDASASFADVLEHGYYGFEVADVECW